MSNDALFEAIRTNDVSRVRDILDADPALASARGADGLSAVTLASYYRRSTIVHELLARRVTLDIWEAAIVGDNGRVRALLADDPSLANRIAPDGFSPLGLAAYFGRLAAAEALLDALLRGRCWATSAIVFRRTLLEKTGPFEPELSIAEDCHLWFRMACAGNLVSGNLARPVAAYWRHAASAYKAVPEQRLHMIRAMTRFLRWMRARDPRDPRLPSVSRCVAEYILTGLASARGERHRRLAWALAARSLAWFPEILLRRRFLGNLGRLALGR